ncbi:MAG: hypothetical protein ABIT01_06265, partial [Thermoanaerobaculia bacterium]
GAGHQDRRDGAGARGRGQRALASTAAAQVELLRRAEGVAAGSGQAVDGAVGVVVEVLGAGVLDRRGLVDAVVDPAYVVVQPLVGLLEDASDLGAAAGSCPDSRGLS